MSKNLIVCDLDGCLNYYPKSFLKWVEKKYGICKRDLTSLKKSLSPKEYEMLKQDYRTCGVKRTLAVRNGAVEALNHFRRLGKKIWISTSRPVFEPVRGDTEYWLRFNEIKHDKLTFLSKNELKNHVSEVTEDIWFLVDDEYHIAVDMAEEFGILVFLFEDQQSSKEIPDLVTKVTSWRDIILSLDHIPIFDNVIVNSKKRHFVIETI